MRNLVYAILGVFSSGLFFVGSMYAQPVLNPTNPYLEVTDAGSAEDIAVIGATDGEAKEDALINVIKGWVNWVLGILALIALIVLMRGGFQMVTAAGNEEQYNKGFTILKQAAIGLILIGVAWFVISIIFWLVNLASDNAGAAGTEN